MRQESESPTEKERLEYFRALEELFIELRGAPLLLSPSDWKVAERWRSAGIPLDLVGPVLERVLSRRSEHRGRSGIKSLRYFDPAVQKAWRERQALGAAESKEEKVPPLDVDRRLASLAASLPETFARTPALRGELARLGGGAEAVERKLGRLDAEMMAVAAAKLTALERRELEAAVEEAVRQLGSRVPESQRERTRKELAQRRLRATHGLPVLSLFSPDASR